jgi:hypothetical protein
MGDDLLWAMNTLGFENYTEPLKTYLFRYREVVWPTTSLSPYDRVSMLPRLITCDYVPPFPQTIKSEKDDDAPASGGQATSETVTMGGGA